MTVAHILAQKGRSVITASPGASLKEVADTLAKHKIGAVVIVDARGGIAGIVSERDVVLAVSTNGAGALSRTAAEVMTAKVRTCTVRDSEEDLMSLMTAHRVRHLPVVEQGKLAGMVSIGDVVKMRIEAVEREAEDMKRYIASAG